MDFTFSDTVFGYIDAEDGAKGTFVVETLDGRKVSGQLTNTCYAKYTFNLNEDWHDAGGDMHKLIKTKGVPVFAYGTYYPSSGGPIFDAQYLIFPANENLEYSQEDGDWWVNQARAIADFYVKSQFNYPAEEIDFNNYQTSLLLSGEKGDNDIQEIDTISRLVYGLASTYMLTGEDHFLEAAEKGTDYLRDRARIIDKERDVTYWCHAVRSNGDKILTSLFGDDYGAIPAYEQIYALAGPTQTYRVTGDSRIMEDIEGTMRLFENVLKDNKNEGYYSHLDPVNLDPKAESLGQNKGKKNWNSVGDHAPAYLINLWLATGDDRHRDMLEYCFDLITKYFPDDDESPFVQEKFNDDWSKDQTWGWQQNRGVVGHNLKIAWNLMRMQSLVPKDSYADLAEKIGRVMPEVGMDKQRAGWYDVVERVEKLNSADPRFVWHDRKAWWQQEQGILAYLILAGINGGEDNLKYARSSAAFYNAFFLDHDAGGVFFNTLASGVAFLQGTERDKGSHSMSGYHSLELCFLAAVYSNLLVSKKPLDLFFAPTPQELPDSILRVSPDILPAGSVQITSCEINGEKYEDFDAKKMTIKLPNMAHRVKVKVTLEAVT